MENFPYIESYFCVWGVILYLGSSCIWVNILMLESRQVELERTITSIGWFKTLKFNCWRNVSKIDFDSMSSFFLWRFGKDCSSLWNFRVLQRLGFGLLDAFNILLLPLPPNFHILIYHEEAKSSSRTPVSKVTILQWIKEVFKTC